MEPRNDGDEYDNHDGGDDAPSHRCAYNFNVLQFSRPKKGLLFFM